MLVGLALPATGSPCLAGPFSVNEPVGINKRIADRLLDDGLIDETDFMRAVEFAKRKQKRIEEVLLELSVIDETKLLKYIATLHKTQFVSTGRLRKAKIDRGALKVVSYKLAKHFGIYPLVLDRVNDKLIVATADPDNAVAIKELQMATRVSRVMPMVARPAAVVAAIARGYKGDRGMFRQLLATRPAELAAEMMLKDPFTNAADGQLGGTAPEEVPHQAPTRPARRRRTGQPHTGEYAPGMGDYDYPHERPSRPRRPTGADPRHHPPEPAGMLAELDEPGFADDAPFLDPEPTPDYGSYGAPPPPRRPRYDEGPDDGYGPEGGGYDSPSRSDTDTGYGNPRGGYARPEPRRPPPYRRRYEEDGPPPDRRRASPPGRRYDHGYDEPPEPEPPSDPTPPGYSAPPPLEQDAPPVPAPSQPKSRSLIPPMKRASYAALGLGPLSTRATIEEEAPPPRAILSSNAYLESLRVLVGLLENDRRDLRGHSAAVARLTQDVAERIALPEDHRNALVLAAYLHDLGKMGQHHLTALNVARDVGHRALATKLWALPEKLMESVGLPEPSVGTLSAMYEQLSGGGIPGALHAKDIPMGARILAAVDSYADLTRNPANAHGKLLSPEQAVEQLRKFAGTVFDKNIIDVLDKATSGEKILTDLLADRHSVLLIDPDPEETMVLQLRLAEQGFDVHVARGLDEARAALGGREFSLVVSEVDLDRPGAGLELRADIGKKTGSWVFLSSSDSRDVARRAFELGVDDFLTKPVATEIVVAKLTQLVERKAERTAPKGVSGSLSEMSLTDIVQVLFHGRKTCALRLNQGDIKGEVHFDQGQIVHAVWGEATSETAFYRMLTIGEDGEFVVDAEFKPTDEPTIQVSPEGLLLEGMRLLDEGAIP